MKKSITFLILILSLLYSVTTVAQQGINYKAVIKDANNAVVANTAVTVQFSVLQGVAQTNVYQETHTPTTDANGIIIINIGEGAVDSGVFADIDWASDTHFLNTQIDTGAGLTDMGTTAFNAVPYALSAKTAENVSGLEATDEGNGLGLVKIGRVEANYGDVGENAVDLSFSSSASTTRGATGERSTAMGSTTTASGYASTAMGNYTTASLDSSTAMGSYTTASGFGSTAMGVRTTASGGMSTVMGNYTTAESFAQTTLGTYNIPTTPISTTGFNALDQLFVVGNGVNFGNRSNALTILKNGIITAPSFDISEITDAKALVTKEYADASIANAASTGLEATDEGNGFGLGLVKVGRVEANYGDVGLDAVDLSYSNSASTTRGATGSFSTATGFNTTASGGSSTAGGAFTIASGNWSTAMGQFTTASGDGSTAMGTITVASGYASTAMGVRTTAESFGQTTIGVYSVPTTPNSTTTFNALDQLLVVGNGTSNTNRSNALTILKNGTITAPSFDISEITDAKALVTKEYADASIANAASTGLESIDEGNGLGLVKVGRVEANYGDVGENAVDLSISASASTSRGATGSESTATGDRTTASGQASTASGTLTRASGRFSFATGRSTTAESFVQTSFGVYNVPTIPISSIAFNALDQLFVVGNGASSANRSNALTILKNGTITAPSFDIAEITDAKALVTKEYADANYSDTGVISTGLEYKDETADATDNGGLVKIGRVATNYGNVGNNAVDLSYSPSASTTYGATGSASTAMGFETTASAFGSTAMGNGTTASGIYSTAMGNGTTASGDRSIASGLSSIASGESSTAMGWSTTAASFAQTTLGVGNVPTIPNSTTNFDPLDQLFVVGNGTSGVSSNALTILKNGNVGIGEISPSTALEVTGVIKAIADNIPALIVSGSTDTGAGDNGIISSNPDYAGSDLFLRSNDAVVMYLDYDNNEDGDFGIINGAGTNVFNVSEAGEATTRALVVSGSADNDSGDNGIISSNPDYAGSDLFLRSNDAVHVYLDYDDNELGDFRIFNGTGAIVFNVSEAGNVVVNGSTVHTSDRRLKKEIETIPFGLKEILQLEPKAYHWKAKDQEHKSLGLIAQDVQKIITNVVQVGDDELKTMGVSYTELIPVLIKATQEQQAIIDAQAKKIKQLEAKNKAFASLEARLSALENNTATASTSTSLKTKK